MHPSIPNKPYISPLVICRSEGSHYGLCVLVPGNLNGFRSRTTPHSPKSYRHDLKKMVSTMMTWHLKWKTYWRSYLTRRLVERRRQNVDAPGLLILPNLQLDKRIRYFGWPPWSWITQMDVHLLHPRFENMNAVLGAFGPRLCLCKVYINSFTFSSFVFIIRLNFLAAFYLYWWFRFVLLH
jgi:hypothetical protein